MTDQSTPGPMFKIGDKICHKEERDCWGFITAFSDDETLLYYHRDEMGTTRSSMLVKDARFAQIPLRLVDSRGAEKDFDYNHIGVYVWLPGSLRDKIANLIGWPVYSVGRDAYGPIDQRVQGKRIFIQTGKRDDQYLLTYEVMDKEICAAVIVILETPITDALREESERDYRKMVGEY